MEILNSIRKDIRELGHYAEGKMPLRSKVNKQLKLSSNESRYGCSPRVLEALQDELQKGLSLYPDKKMKALKQGVVEYWTGRGIKIAPENLLFGDASGEILNMVLASFVQDGDAVVIPENSFILYSLLSLPKGARVIEVKRKDYHADLKAIAGAVKKAKETKVVIIANPDNPTSTFLSFDDIAQFMKAIPGNVAVVLDEAYMHFAGMDNSAIKLLESYPNLILSYTFSKAYGLAGLRVGYAVMHVQIAEQIEKIRLPFNLGMLQQRGALEAIKDDAFVDNVVVEISKGQAYMASLLKSLDIWHLRPYGNFVFADFGPDYKRILDYLEEYGISIRSLNEFGYPDSFVRITIGTQEDNEYLARILTEAVEK